MKFDLTGISQVIEIIESKLTEKDFSIENLFEIMDCQSIEGIFEELLEQMNFFNNTNFFPISSRLLWILANLYKFCNNGPSFIYSAFLCLLPRYNTYIGDRSVTLWVENYKIFGNVSLDIMKSLSPLVFEARFSSKKYWLSDQPEVIVIIRSLLPFDTILNSVIISIENANHTNSQLVLPPIELKSKQTRRNIYKVKLNGVGENKLNKVTYSIDNLTFNTSIVSIDNCTLFNQDYAIKVIPKVPKYGYSFVDFPIIINFENIPIDGVRRITKIIPISHETNVSCKSSCERTSIFVEESQGKTASEPIQANFYLDNSATVLFNISIEFITPEGELKYFDRFSISFRSPFLFSFNVSNSCHKDQNLEKPIVEVGSISTLISTIIYSCPDWIELKSIKVYPQNGFCFTEIDHGLPVVLATQEEFTSLFVFNSTQNGNDISLGDIEITFGSSLSQHPFVFRHKLQHVDSIIPEIEVEHIHSPELYIHEKSSISLKIKSKNQNINVYLSIGKSSDFLVEGITKQALALTTSYTDISINIIPLRLGSRKLPTMQVLHIYNNERNVLWSNTTSVFVIQGTKFEP